jgi:hypothetical protein
MVVSPAVAEVAENATRLVKTDIRYLVWLSVFTEWGGIRYAFRSILHNFGIDLLPG